MGPPRPQQMYQSPPGFRQCPTISAGGRGAPPPLGYRYCWNSSIVMVVPPTSSAIIRLSAAS